MTLGELSPALCRDEITGEAAVPGLGTLGSSYPATRVGEFVLHTAAEQIGLH